MVFLLNYNSKFPQFQCSIAPFNIGFWRKRKLISFFFKWCCFLSLLSMPLHTFFFLFVFRDATMCPVYGGRVEFSLSRGSWESWPRKWKLVYGDRVMVNWNSCEAVRWMSSIRAYHKAIIIKRVVNEVKVDNGRRQNWRFVSPL